MWKLVFLILAIICFVLIGLGLGVLANQMAWGLAFFAASFLPFKQ